MSFKTKEEQAAFWRACEEAAKRVAKWPAWKRRAADEQLRVSGKGGAE